MTEAAQTVLSNDRPASPARERVDSISAGAALGKPVGSGLARFSVVSDKAATGARRQRSESALYQLAGDLMSSPAITVRTTEPVSSVARLMLESGDQRGSGARCWRTAGRHGERRRSSRASRRRPSLPMARDAGEAVSASQERSRAPCRRGHERALDHRFAESLGAGHRRDFPSASDQASAGAGRRRPGRRREPGGPSLPRREPASRSACPAR